jgi:NUMOD3 motif
MHNHYVYYYLRSQDTETARAGTPYYVGEGKGNRIIDKQHNVIVPQDATLRVKIAENLTKEQAQAIEILHIAMWGRKDLGTGILHNKTAGGDGVTGHSDETRQKMREKKLGRKYIMSESHKSAISRGKIGHEVTEETREKIREKRKNQIIPKHSEETKQRMSEMRMGEKNPMFGKEFSEEHRRRLSESKKGIVFSEERRKNISESLKGKPSPTKGKPRPPEVIAKILETKKRKKLENPDLVVKRKPLSEETKRKIGEANRLRSIEKKRLRDEVSK